MLRLDQHGDVTRVHLASARSTLVGYSVSAYLVRGVLIDTGFAAVWRDVAYLLDARRPRGVILTHKHEDHAGNIERVAARGIPIAAAESTLAAVRDPRTTQVAFYRRFTWGTMPVLRSRVVPFDTGALSLVPAPGHSTDHHVVWDAEQRTLFSADLFLGVKVRVAHPGEDLRLLARTLRAIAALEPRRMFDAHRGPVPDPAASLIAKADWLDETIAHIDRRMDEGASDSAILDDVLGGESLAGWFSLGDYSRMNFVRGLRETGEREEG